MKKIILCVIILIVVSLLVFIVVKNTNSNQIEDKSKEITKTVKIEEKEAKYTFLKNSDGTIYAIKFENLDLITRITMTKREGDSQEIKDLITDNIYQFEENGIYKMEMQTINDRVINTDTFKVNAKK